VALKGALENELFGHLAGSFGRCSIDLRRRVWTKYREIFCVGGISKRHPKAASATSSDPAMQETLETALLARRNVILRGIITIQSILSL
jgi:hypothetical protein